LKLCRHWTKIPIGTTGTLNSQNIPMHFAKSGFAICTNHAIYCPGFSRIPVKPYNSFYGMFFASFTGLLQFF
jgi:hypothetical protein